MLASIIASLYDNEQEVMFHFTKAIELEPTWLAPRRMFAGYLVQKGHLQAAKEQTVQALAYIPKMIPVLDNPILEHYEDRAG